ncbi:MAG: right-handed parallel beta-helix repeat-containing protein [Planctomyces sp.]|nr:right-handed parallel beta-helix repeat-containing protein [Planctomyces sp.]
MKTKRVYATACLLFSSVALFSAATRTIGDEPGKVRLSSFGSQTGGPGGGTVPTPIPDPMNGAMAPGFAPGQMVQGPGMNGPYPVPDNTAPYFERSFGATQYIPNESFMPKQPFGPALMFESNIDNGLGFNSGYHRLNARIPYHIVPDTTVMIGDLSGSVTNDGDPVYNYGLVYRNYDAALNRIFGWNVFGDYEKGQQTGEFYRMSAGFESLGKYIDWRANGYFILGDDSYLLNSQLTGDHVLGGNNLFRLRDESYQNAYSGGDLEVGGPLPLLGRYGLDMYVGGYVLGNDNGYDTVGFQARWQAMITESITVNTYLTTDDTFGTNSWVSMAFTFPNYKDRRILRPNSSVRERLQDPVYRSNRIHQNIDNSLAREAIINNGEDVNGNGILDPGEDINGDGVLSTGTGLPYFITYVDPNSTATGVGTFENPYGTFQQAAAGNNAGIDIIRVLPRTDDTGTNLTALGGIQLFDDQYLIAGNRDFTLFTVNGEDCIIPGTPNTSGLGPLISDPAMLAGGSVVQLANNNTIFGMRISGANAAGTVFGNGVSNAAPITDVRLSSNTFTNYNNGAELSDVSGRVIIEQNNFSGLAGTSQNGLLLTAAAGQTVELLVEENQATNNQQVGLSIIAEPGATINANNPTGTLPTGIVGNTATGNGTGIHVEARTGAVINAVVEDNTTSGNTADGLAMVADGGTFNLSSLSNNLFSNNTGNGVFIHYLNGGTFTAVSEDADGDGSLDAGEDLNGNGTLDFGIVSNAANSNGIAGICIFGEDASTGTFDIGGPQTALGNSFIGNVGAGIAVDLRDTATAQMDTVNNIISSSSVANSAPTLTFVLDFVEAGQTIVDPFGGGTFTPFDVTSFGFAASEYDTVTNAVLETVRQHYYNIPTSGVDSRSPMPDGQQLDVNFVIGDLGTAPTIGATEFYTTVIGSAPTAPALGVAFLSAVRDASGAGPLPGFTNGSHVASVYSNQINALGGLTPADITIPDEPPGVHYDIATGDGTQILQDALTSGNLTFTRNALAGTTSHEIGHTLSLTHMNVAGSVTPTGAPPIMGTGAIDTPNQARIGLREFGYSGFDGENGNAPIFHVQQLMNAVGTRDAAVAGVSGDGIVVNATDNAVLQASTFINNTITQNSGDGLAVRMNDNAVTQGLTIQGNRIEDNTGRGIDLQANGAGTFIDADGTIGGNGVNILGGSSFSQGNTISGNQLDGVRALASDGGVIHGNLINNLIEENGQNGVALSIDNGGEVDFGTTASNRVIRGNAINRNGGAGIALTSNVSAASQAEMRATVLGNTISGNVSGGIAANLNGSNNPPSPPAVPDNNRLILNVGTAATADANTLNGNGDVGIGVNVTGNGHAMVDVRNATITGTVNGADPILNGDGINFRRSGSGVLEAVVEDSTITGNAGDGLDVDVQGQDKNDVNSPVPGTVNTVEWNRNNLSNNTQNGARFRTRGDAQLIADGANNTLNNNGANGILVQTSENSSFGDPTDGAPPGRRVVFDGNVMNNNTVDGLNILATENSRALVEVTSTAIPPASGAHAALSNEGATGISGNGRDGIRIDTTGGRSDILITSGTEQTTISGNGTNGGGNGIRWNASGTSEGSVRITNVDIFGNLRGGSEDSNADGVLALNEDANLNGILENGEDLNGNGVLDTGEDANANLDIDVADGDGIQFNASDDANTTLIVGGVGDGNTIQRNQDDAIAITVTGSAATGTPRPIISIIENTLGGEANGVAAGNRGDGISINTFGDRSQGAGDLIAEVGPQAEITATGNVISQNTQRGISVLLNGAGGVRDREGAGAGTFDPINITINENNIHSNGTEGIFYQANPGYVSNRPVFLGNTGFPGDNRQPEFTGVDGAGNGTGNNAAGSQAFYNPGLPQFTNLNAGSINGNTAYMPPYLNLATEQNSFVRILDNRIQSNGTGTVTGEGIVMRVGTNAYVAADIQRNEMGGNLEEDLRTESFRYSANPENFIDNTGIGTFDVVFLDDTAQFDLRFQDNTGNQILTNSAGAAFTNGDIAKVFQPGVPNVLNRPVSFFQVDNGPNLNNPNNTFINFGITQNINGAFTTGGYNIRGAADPLFPNIGFAPPLP